MFSFSIIVFVCFHHFYFIFCFLFSFSLFYFSLVIQLKLIVNFKCNISYFHHVFFLKGWLTGFILGLIVFMGCNLTCVNASFVKKHTIFPHNLPLFHTAMSLL